MMQNTSEVEETTTTTTATVPKRESIEILALNLAQTLKPDTSIEHGNPVQLRLKDLETFIASAYQHFEGTDKTKAPTHQAAEWVLDNFYVIEQAIQQVREGMPAKYYRRLPRVMLDNEASLASVHALSIAITDATECRLDIPQLDNFVHAYQEIKALTIGEIWALPLMLRLSILETLSLALSNVTGISFQTPVYSAILRTDAPNHPHATDETIVAN